MGSSQPAKKRPTGIMIIAIVAAAGGLLSLFGGASVLVGMPSGPIALAYIVIIFGILGLSLGAGFFTGAKWAWMAGIGIYVISIGLGIAEIIYGGQVGLIGGIIRTIAGIVIPIYLTRPKAKAFFGQGPKQSQHVDSFIGNISVNACGSILPLVKQSDIQLRKN